MKSKMKQALVVLFVVAAIVAGTLGVVTFAPKAEAHTMTFPDQQVEQCTTYCSSYINGQCTAWSTLCY